MDKIRRESWKEKDEMMWYGGVEGINLIAKPS